MRTVNRIVLSASIVAGVTMAASCGSNTASPSLLQVAGTWRGTQVLTQVIGGECIGEYDKAFVGSTIDLSVRITQTGEVLNANLPGCALTGTVQRNTVTLRSVDALCQQIQRNVFCPSLA